MILRHISNTTRPDYLFPLGNPPTVTKRMTAGETTVLNERPPNHWTNQVSSEFLAQAYPASPSYHHRILQD